MLWNFLRAMVFGEVNPGTGAGGTARVHGITSVVRSGAGVYVVTLAAGFAAQEMGFVVSPSQNNAAGISATWTRTTETTITVQTHLTSTGAAQDSTFSILGYSLPAGNLVIA